MTEPLCTCGKRPKHKCCEENEHGSGKMCLKGYDAQFINLKGLSEATEDRMSKVDRDIRQLRKEVEEELEKYENYMVTNRTTRL